jgi:glutathione S-transferase
VGKTRHLQPILYSFRRCPYAMRARLAVASAGVSVELREIALRDKPAAFLAASSSGTVPCLMTAQGAIDESLDIMTWALARSDPKGWLRMPAEGHALIAQNDGPFKTALDRTKYASRYPNDDPLLNRALASAFLTELDSRIDGWIFDHPTLADFAILPFVRQFALIDKTWFDAQPWPDLQSWLARFLASDRFAGIMVKYPAWTEGDPPQVFPNPAQA